MSCDRSCIWPSFGGRDDPRFALFCRSCCFSEVSSSSGALRKHTQTRAQTRIVPKPGGAMASEGFRLRVGVYLGTSSQLSLFSSFRAGVFGRLPMALLGRCRFVPRLARRAVSSMMLQGFPVLVLGFGCGYTACLWWCPVFGFVLFPCRLGWVVPVDRFLWFVCSCALILKGGEHSLDDPCLGTCVICTSSPHFVAVLMYCD